MKKLLLTLALTLSVFTASAQIQRTHLGCTVGLSSLNHVLTTMEKQGMPLTQSEYDPNTYDYASDYGFNYGGTTWTYLKFTFYNGTLCSLNFMSVAETSESAYINLYNKLSNKYSSYQKREFDPEGFLNGALFMDNRTSLMVSRSNDFLTLLYMDATLMELKMQSNNDEL